MFKIEIDDCKENGGYRIVSKDGHTYYIDKDGYKEITFKEAQEIMNKTKVNKLSFTNEDVNYFRDMYDLIQKQRKDKTGDYAERVIVENIYFNSTLTPAEEGRFAGNLEFAYKVLGDTTGKEYYDRYEVKLHGLNSKINPTEDYIRKMLILVFSGIYATPYDYENLLVAMETVGFVRKKNVKPFYCQGCEERFEKPEDLINHLDETGHYDDYFEQYPYFEPLIKIKEKWGHK